MNTIRPTIAKALLKNPTVHFPFKRRIRSDASAFRVHDHYKSESLRVKKALDFGCRTLVHFVGAGFNSNPPTHWRDQFPIEKADHPDSLNILDTRHFSL